MVKFIYYLIICCILLLNSCKEPNAMPKGPDEGNNPKNGSNDHKAHKKVKPALTPEELRQQKFNIFKQGVSKSIKRHISEDTHIDFYDWILKDENKLKQQELADAFTIAYDLLEARRLKYTPETTLNQYIDDALHSDYFGSDIRYGQINKFFMNIVSEIMNDTLNYEQILENTKKFLMSEDKLSLIRN